jgi:hypothetical protein
MKANYKLALALIAGIAVGGAVIKEVHAQMKPPTYVVVDADGYKEVRAKAPASAAAAGAAFVIRTDK